MTRKENQTLTTQFITPPCYACGMEGVYLLKSNGRQVRILDVPVWISEINNNADGNDAHTTLEWLTVRGQHRKNSIPLRTLMDARATCKWLARRGVTGFNPSRPSLVSNYLVECVRARQESTNPGLPKIRDHVETDKA